MKVVLNSVDFAKLLAGYHEWAMIAGNSYRMSVTVNTAAHGPVVIIRAECRGKEWHVEYQDVAIC